MLEIQQAQRRAGGGAIRVARIGGARPQPLHGGGYGGMPFKIPWAVLDLLAIVVLGSGVYLWLKKRNVSFETWLQSVQPSAQPSETALSR